MKSKNKPSVVVRWHGATPKAVELAANAFGSALAKQASENQDNQGDKGRVSRGYNQGDNL